MNADVTSLDISTKTVAEILGEIVWLMSQDKRERSHSIGDLERLVMPAIMLKQFRIFYAPANDDQNTSDGSSKNAPRPVGAAIWAMVSDRIAAEITASHPRADAITANEWASGSNRVILRIIAPYGGETEMRSSLNTL